MITEPGIYDGLPEAEYHAHPALSSTGARHMLPPSCPALFKYEQDHPVFKDVFDYGSAAHKLVLGTGPKIEIIEYDDWRTKDAQERKKAARASGFVPLLRKEYERVEAMAAAIQDHHIAGPLFDPLNGLAEQSVFWTDEEFRVQLRCRPDFMPHQRDRWGRLIIADYKTIDECDVESCVKATANHGYHQQDAFYTDGVRAVGLCDDPQFMFVFQMKQPPYLVTPVQLGPEDRQIGRERNRKAIERFRDCTESGIWPAHTDEIETITLPPWARSRGDDLL